MTSFTLTADVLDTIPYLELAPSDLSADAPTVLVLHGLGSRKEKMLPIAYALAAQGKRTILPDLCLHGERMDAEQRDARMQSAYIKTIFQMIQGTAHDVVTLLDHFRLDQAGIHGISLGGFVAFAALVTEPRLTVAAVAMGNPDWLGLAQSNGLKPGDPLGEAIAAVSPLELAAATYPLRPLLMLHGVQDEVVPVSGTRRLHALLSPVYHTSPERLQYVEYPNVGHVYTDDMLSRTSAWFQNFLV